MSEVWLRFLRSQRVTLASASSFAGSTKHIQRQWSFTTLLVRQRRCTTSDHHPTARPPNRTTTPPHDRTTASAHTARRPRNARGQTHSARRQREPTTERTNHQPSNQPTANQPTNQPTNQRTNTNTRTRRRRRFIVRSLFVRRSFIRLIDSSFVVRLVSRRSEFCSIEFGIANRAHQHARTHSPTLCSYDGFTSLCGTVLNFNFQKSFYELYVIRNCGSWRGKRQGGRNRRKM